MQSPRERKKEETLSIGEALTPYGVSRKEVGRARRLGTLTELSPQHAIRTSKLHSVSNSTKPLERNSRGALPRPKGRPAGAKGEALDRGAQSEPSPEGTTRLTLPYAPLHLYTGYAFGRGTMLAEEIPLICAAAGIKVAAIADPFALTGCVEFVKRSKASGIKPLVGASVQLPEGGWLVLIAKTKVGYQSLSELLSACHLDEPRQFPMATWSRLQRYSRDLICLTGGDIGPLDRLLVQGQLPEAQKLVERLCEIYGRSNVAIEIERSYLPWQIVANRRLLELAEACEVLPVAGGCITHARPQHFPAQDMLVCAETLCTVDEIIGRKLQREASQPQLDPRPERAINAERYLRTPAEMTRLFVDRPDLLENTLRIADRCEDDVLPGRTRLPEIFPDPCHALREITLAGAHQHYGTMQPRLKRRIEQELSRINALNFADHFLAIWDACNWAREQGIQFSGRGSVVDSAVAYCLGLSRIDAFKHNLHFDRFLPADGSKRPDIDVDFEARRRDDVRLYFARKYGEDRVAGISAIGAYCTRGIIREVGKALGLPNETIGFLAKKVHGGIPPDQLESALTSRPELAGSGIPKERFRWVFELSERLMDIPRNMRSHSSGLLLSSRPIRETAPLLWSASPFSMERIPSNGDQVFRFSGFQDYSAAIAHSDDRHLAPEHLSTQNLNTTSSPLFPIIQWDKRSAKHFFDKFDILCLRGQDVLSGTQERIRLRARSEVRCPRSEASRSEESDRHPLCDSQIKSVSGESHSRFLASLGMTPAPIPSPQHPAPNTQHHPYADFSVERLPTDDEETYRAMRSGELIGIPQSASPAMRQAHIRLRTQDLHDASLVQAGIRPGVGGAVKINELIARRRGKPYSFEHPELERILGLTYGIIVFQEQVDQLLQTFCGYTSGEAEDMREAIHKRRSEDYGRQMKEQIVAKVLSNGFSASVAEQVYDYVSGFKGYGFAQGHALAFAEISIRSIYCQQNFPAEYFAALLTAQPAGYYGESTLCNEARIRGVKMLPPDVNLSQVTYSVEDVKSDMDPKIVLPNAAIRVGLMRVQGLSKETRERITRGDGDGENCMYGESGESCLRNDSHHAYNPHHSHHSHHPHQFFSFFDFVLRVRPDRDELENLILCGALDSLHPNRRALLWAIPSAIEFAELHGAMHDARIKRSGSQVVGLSGLPVRPENPTPENLNTPARRKPSISNRKSEIPLPLSFPEPELPTGIEDFSEAEKAVFERSLLGLDVERHLMAFERERVRNRGGITCLEAKSLAPGRKTIVVGNPIRLRFPPTPSGKRVVFFDLEDETGLLNVTCFDATYRRDGHAIVCSPYVTLIGVAQDRDGHTAFLAQRVFPYHPVLGKLTPADTALPLTTADFLAQ